MSKDTRGPRNEKSTAVQTKGAPKIGSRAAILAAAKAAGIAEADIDWLSKGVDYYSFLGDGTFNSSFSQPVDWGDDTQTYDLNTPGQMQSGNLQISVDDIAWYDFTGEFSWIVEQNGAEIATNYADINPITGNLGNTSMGDMLATPSVIGPGWALSYGFYDAGAGWTGLTNQDQSYVYVTRDLSSWMGGLAITQGANFTNQPFAVLALPGAHDCGMFDPTAAAQLVQNVTFLTLLAPAIGIALELLEALDPSAILRIVINFAMTQKDNITTMLNLGIRYFDFRPGYCFQTLLPGIYHQHSFIPGYPYQSFLNDVLNWLTTHPTEIVVVSANFQGLADTSMAPSVPVLQAVLTAAQQATGTGQSIVPGDKYDLGSTYASLIANKKRLIFLNQIGAPDDTKKYDSYSIAYQTTDVAVILQAIGAMTESGQAQNDSDYTVLQLQGTANALVAGMFSSVATMSDASSPLMSTKPGFDNQTYPWVQTNVQQQLSAGQLVVFLNDFADNALTSAAIQVITQRMGKQPDLWFIKTQNTSSKFIEVHQRTAVSNYQSGLDRATSLMPFDAGNGRFMMVASDLWFIKTIETGTGFVELHERTLVSNYQSGIDVRTSLLPADASNGWFQMVGADLWFIQTQNTTSKFVEVHLRTAASSYQSGLDVATSLQPFDANNGWFQMVGADLWFIKTQNTGSKFVELHQRTAASNYQSGLDAATSLLPADAENGWFQMVGPNLWFIKTQNASSKFVEVHSRTAASSYESGLDLATSLLPADANNGPFQMGWPVLL